jgi:ABC-type glycerol-3-phosphate transport system permease component
LLLLATLMIPDEVILIPNYVIVYRLGWINTYLALIVPFMAGVFGIFLLRQFFRSLPRDLFEAAMLDGASHLQTIWYVVLPLARPALLTVGLLSFLGSWNSFLWPLLMLDQPSMQTIPVALASLQFSGATMDPIFWTGVLAGTVLVTLPLVVLFLFAQRFFVSGIMSGAFKGGAQ